MRRIAVVLGLLTMGGVVGCAGAPQEGSLVLEGSGAGKADSVVGLALHYQSRGEWAMPLSDKEKADWAAGKSITLHTDSTVISQTSNAMRFESLNAYYPPLESGILTVSTKAESFNDFGSLSTTMAMLLFQQDEGTYSWRLINCPSMNYFAKIRVNGTYHEIDGFDPLDDTSSTFTYDECGVQGDNPKLSVMVFPAKGWGNLEGYYHATVAASLSSTP